MELETASPTADEQARFAASAKKLTIQPISRSVLPEHSEGSELNSRMSETAHTKNPTNDSEDTALQQKRNQKRSANTVSQTSAQPPKRTLVAGTLIVCCFVAAFLWAATQ